MARKQLVTDTLPKKVRKKRKPMSEEQRLAASERLALARAKRQAANPPSYVNVHPNVVALDDDHYLSMKNVREWIKYQREISASEGKSARAGVKGAEAKYRSATAYIANMEGYLKNGAWSDTFYGQARDNLMAWQCIAMAYHSDGTPKRTKGTFYADLGYRWGFNPADVDEPETEATLEELFL